MPNLLSGCFFQYLNVSSSSVLRLPCFNQDEQIVSELISTTLSNPASWIPCKTQSDSSAQMTATCVDSVRQGSTI